MGNLPQVVKDHYFEIVDEHDAKAYWSIKPAAARRPQNRCYRIVATASCALRMGAESLFDCPMANDPATINKESTNENNTDVDRWVDARRLRINGKPCS
jgi:hypothetical protein